MSLALILAQCAAIAERDREAIVQSYAWPPRPDLTSEERREADRLDALSRRLAYKARELGQVDQSYDVLFGSEEVAT